MNILVIVVGAVAGVFVVSKLSGIAPKKIPFKKKQQVNQTATAEPVQDQIIATPLTETTTHIRTQHIDANHQADIFHILQPSLIALDQAYLDQLPVLTHKTIGRRTELAQITRAVHMKKQAIAIIAFAGVGKTMLVRQWLENLKQKDYEDFDDKNIFAWSFYHQPQSVAFFKAALSFFGADEIPKQDAQKGQLLADLLFKDRAILILDSLEQLQNPADVLGGRCKDVALQQFFTAIKQSESTTNSVILITSRQPVVELKDFAHFKQIDLRLLSDTNGAKLLKSLQVAGTNRELQKVSKEHDGHALALVLLAKLLSEQFQADVKFCAQLPKLDKNNLLNQCYVQRILQAYDEQIWDADSVERQFLYALSLFDRPMHFNEKQVLFEKADFAQTLAQLSESELQNVISKLEAAHLVFSSETGWDCHPIVRQYFRQRFEKTQNEAFQQAQAILAG